MSPASQLLLMVHPPAWSHRAWDAEDAEDADVGAGWGGAGTQGA